MKKISLIILYLLIALGISIICLVWYMWRGAPDPREIQSQIRTQYKSLRFENKYDSTYFFIKINFEYTPQDSLSYTESKMDSIISLSKLDSLMLNYYPSNESSLLLPILRTDSVKFPKSFYIKIYNKDKNELLKELDYNSFMQHAILKYVANETNPLTAQQWTLVIDSTLLDLKK